MWAPIELDEEATKKVEEFRSTNGCGVSEAINELMPARCARAAAPTVPTATPRLGVRIDVSCVARALDSLEPADRRS